MLFVMFFYYTSFPNTVIVLFTFQSNAYRAVRTGQPRNEIQIFQTPKSPGRTRKDEILSMLMDGVF